MNDPTNETIKLCPHCHCEMDETDGGYHHGWHEWTEWTCPECGHRESDEPNYEDYE